MAELQKTRILPNERQDRPDYNKIEDFVCADFKAIHKNVWTNNNFVVSGFEASGIGTPTLSLVLAGSTVIVGEDDGTLFIGAPSLAPLTTTALTPGTTNFIEIFTDLDTGGADSRAFWDQTAAGGLGGEFSQIVDTFIFLEAKLNINTSNFTGDADKVPICEVDVNGSGVITAIREGRSQLFRLGRPADVNFDFAWTSRIEPPDTQFTGADKDINNLKEWMDAVMSRIRENSGTIFWYEAPGVSLTGAFQNAALSAISGLTAGARFSWSGTNLSITDDDGTPADADAIAAVRLFSSSANLQLTRMDGTGSSTTIAIADDEVLWIEFSDPLASTNYDDVGLAQTNYRVSARGSVPLNETTFWLAYREGSNIYVRGLGELEPNESAEISDNINENILAAIGLASEVASPNYTAFTTGSLNLPNYNTTTNESIISRVAKVTAMLADIRQDLNIELDPGTIVWTGSDIDITGAQLSIPGTTVGTAPVSITNIASVALADNEAIYVDISRTSGTTLVLAQATLVSLTPSQQRLILVRRIGSELLVR